MPVFADFSKKAYTVACFGCFVLENSKVSVAFLFGKCKVCPISGALIISRLELVAAALATHVASDLCDQLQSGIL